jgi:hypothetical protein
MAPNDGRYKLSAEGRRAHKQLCADLKDIMEGADKACQEAFDAGDMKGARDAFTTSVAAESDGHDLGCSWARG